MTCRASMSFRLAALAAVLVLCGNCYVVTCLRPLEQFASLLMRPTTTVDGRMDEPQPLEDKPWFCHDLDCPKYKVVNSSATYETRVYEKSQWAFTLVEGILYAPSQTVGFKRLFDYISGANEDNKKIAMTSPVATWVEPGQGPFCKSNFSVGFFVPFEYQGHAPKPNNTDVVLKTIPERTAYVTQFGGYLVDDITLSAKFKALRSALEANNEVFVDSGSYATMSYDPPFRLQHRHNEVAIPKSM